VERTGPQVHRERFRHQSANQRHHILGAEPQSIYRLIEQDDFPKQVRLGERAAGWVEEEVDGWLRERIERSRMHAASVR
jgi:predicted DNA-binding transcriptional regulator AlpA